MTLLNAVALAGLGLAAPLVLLYLLKMKRLERTVPSTLLWARVIQDLQAAHPFQKLRRNLLLLLQLLMLALLVLALARPALSSSAPEGRAVALIVDCSASMKARDVDGKTRFEEACRLAREVVDSLPRPGAEAMVIAAGPRTSVGAGLTTDRVTLHRALEALETRDAAGDLNRALALAVAALRGRARTEIYLFSDGATARFDPLPGLGAVRYFRIGSTADNAAITMLDVRPAPPTRLAELKSQGKLEDGRFPFQIFAGLRKSGPRAAKGFLALYLGDRLSAAREVNLPPDGEASVVFEDQYPPGPARLELEFEDVLPLDNTVHFHLRAPVEAKVALLNPRTPFLARAFWSFPYVTAVRVNEAALRAEGFDLVVSEGDVPQPLPDAPFVVFRPEAPFPDAEFAGKVEFPAITDWSRDDPIFRAVDFADVHIAETLGSSTPPAGRVLLKGPAGLPLAVLSRRPGQPFRLAFGFALADSDWPLRPSFPIFAWNLVRRAAESETVAGASHLRTGMAAPLPSLGPSVRITDPAGRVYSLEVTPGGDPPVFTETLEAGLYTADWGGDRKIRFGTSLLDARESAIAPAPEIALGTERHEARAAETVRHRELWPWLAAGVLLLALTEWWAFHRKAGS